MKENKFYTLGLDIGIASVGWALLDKEKRVIVDRGVRIFTQAENPKNGKSLAEPRRGARGIRRRLRRRAFRLKRLKNKIAELGMVEQDLLRRADSPLFFADKTQKPFPEPYTLRSRGLDALLSPRQWARVLIHIMKNRGFESNSKGESKARDKEEKAKEDGLLAGVATTSRLVEEKYRTPGEMFAKDPLFAEKKHNSSGDYKKTVGRTLIKKELMLLFKKQRQFQNPFAQKEFEDFCVGLFSERRHYAEGPGNAKPGEPSPYGGNLIEKMVGACTFDPEERRAPAAGYTTERFRLLTAFRNLQLGQYGKYRGLNNQELSLLTERAENQAKLTYRQVKKFLNLPEQTKFKALAYEVDYKTINRTIYNADQTDKPFYKKHREDKDFIPRLADLLNSGKGKEEKKADLADKQVPEKIAKALLALVADSESRAVFEWKGFPRLKAKIKKACEEFWQELINDYKQSVSEKQIFRIAKLDKAAEILTLYREDDVSVKLKELGFPEKVIEALQGESFDKFKHLSYKALYRILPYLEQGCAYSEACAKAGYDHAKSAKGYRIEDITSPVVKRSVLQTIKVLKALQKKYGKFCFVCVETARDLSKGKAERDEIARGQEDFRREKKRADSEFNERFGRIPKGAESLKFRFYREQQGKCPYCGKPLSIDHDVEKADQGALQIDHILPFGRSLDDSLNNKVLVCAPCNQKKGNKTPFEFIAGGDENSRQWQKVIALCGHYKKAKKDRILDTDFTINRAKDYRTRNINDTRYITRFLRGYLEQELTLAAPAAGVKQQIFTIKGAATAVLRAVWGLNSLKYTYTEGSEGSKTRENDRNHAVDALCVAAAGPALIQYISAANKKNELFFRQTDNIIFDPSTEEVIENPGRENRISKKAQALLPEPWPSFRAEAKIAINSQNPKEELEQLPGGEKYRDSRVKPLFVSRRVNRKQTGELHKQTILSTKLPQALNKADTVVRKKPLSKIKLKDLEKMLGGRDNGKPTPLYQALKKQLEEHGDKPEKAFANGFRKPGKNEQGPWVKSVRVTESMGGGVEVRGGKAESGSGSMIRVDVFYRPKPLKEQGYYLVPIYLSHKLEPALPDKAIVGGKSEADWKPMKQTEFCFSLYPGDLVELTEKDESTTPTKGGGLYDPYKGFLLLK